MTTVLVIHAKHLTDRQRHMERQLQGWPGAVEYILDHDKGELTEELMATYLRPGCELWDRPGPASCAIKHLLACQYIVEHDLEGALVLEDDIVLHPHFAEDFRQTLEECRREYADRAVIISYEDSSLQFIPRSRRRKGQWLYEAPQGRVRFNGAIYINRKAAGAIVADVRENKCDVAVDHYYVHLYGRGLLQMLWCEPALATQGSFKGAFSSSIQGQTRAMEGLRWKAKRAYKRLVYWFR